MNTATTATTPMTAEEFAEWVNRPENRERRFELVRGEVVEMSRPGELHAIVCANVIALLHAYTKQRRKGRVLANDPGVIVERSPDTVRGPDVVFYDASRNYRNLNPKWCEGPPTLAVEVLSPTDRIGNTTRRVNELIRSGVRLVWVVDPDACDVTVLQPGKQSYVVEGEMELTGDDVFPDLRFPVRECFFTNDEESAPTEG